MLGSKYQELAMRTNDGLCTDRLKLAIHIGYNPGDLLNGALGLTGEAGEVADMIKKYVFHGHELDINELSKELGDVMWYVALLCNASGISMSEVMTRNIEKLMVRYPEGFSETASINRTE